MNEPNSERSHTSNLEELNKTLQRIGEESIRLEEEWGKSRPLLCYALHPDVLSNDDYEKLRNLIVNKSFYDLLNKFSPHRNCERQRGIIVFLIRKFFEDSDGKNCWKVWGEESPEWKGKVQECFSTYDEQNLIGENDDKDLAGESSSLREYLKFHCWALKCDEENERKGVSSTRIKVNTDYHSKLEGSCESEKMKRILEADSRDECVGESEDPPKYVKCLLSDFWQEYLLSLCCIAAPENDKDVEELIDDNEWKWLKPLVGRAPSKEPTASWRWHLIDSRGDCYLDSEGLKDEYQYKQSSDDSSDDKRSVEQEEIDPTKETEVLKDEKTIGRIKNLSKIVTPIGDFIILPSPLRRNSEKFYLLHRNSDAPQIVVGDDQKQEAEKNPNTREIKNCYGKGWYCTEYALPCANADGLSLYVTIDGQGPYPLLDLRPKFKVCNEVLYLKGKEIHIVKPEGSDRVVRIDTRHVIELVKAPEGCKLQKGEQSYIIHLPDRHSYDGYLELLDSGENKIEKIKIYVLPEQMESAFAKGDDWYKNIYKRGVEVWREKDTNGKLGTIELPLSETKWWWKRKREGKTIWSKETYFPSLHGHEEDELYFRSPCECDLCFECAEGRFTLETAQNRRRRQLRYILGDIDKKVKGKHPVDIKLLIVEKTGTKEEESPIHVLDAPYLPAGPEINLDRWWRIIGRNLDASTGRLVIEHEKFYYSSEQEKAHYRIERELSELRYDRGERIIMPSLPDDWSNDCIICYLEQDSGATPFGWVLKNPEKEGTLVERIEKSGNNALSNIVPHLAWLWQNRHQPLYKSIIDYMKQELEETVQEQDFINK